MLRKFILSFCVALVTFGASIWISLVSVLLTFETDSGFFVASFFTTNWSMFVIWQHIIPQSTGCSFLPSKEMFLVSFLTNSLLAGVIAFLWLTRREWRRLRLR